MEATLKEAPVSAGPEQTRNWGHFCNKEYGHGARVSSMATTNARSEIEKFTKTFFRCVHEHIIKNKARHASSRKLANLFKKHWLLLQRCQKLLRLEP